MPTRGELAKQRFREGYNCAQAVFLAFDGDTAIDRETAARLCNCLGGGFSQTGGMCGAVSAACLAVSEKHGRSEPSREGEQLLRQQTTYRLVQELQQRFTEAYGSLDCPALLERGKLDSGAACDEKFNCADYVALAADLTEKARNTDA